MLSLGRVIGGIICAVSLTFGVGVEATVNTQEVVSNNVVLYSIKATGTDVTFPSITSIGGNRILKRGDETHFSSSIINGQNVSEQSKTRKFAFKPKSGMVIPSYAVTIDGKIYKTNAIKITVIKSNAPAIKQKQKYAFVLKSSKKTVTVGEPFVLTLYLTLLNTSGVRQVGNYVEPSSSHMVFKALGKQKQYTKANQTIIEKSYSAIATQEGELSISPAAAQLGISNGRSRGFFSNLTLQWVEVKSNALKITALKQEVASDLVGEFRVKHTIDKVKVKANTPVNLTISIQGKGDLETFEFPVYEIDGVTIYSDDAKVESRKSSNDIVSRYSKSFAFISDSTFEIPARSITVYSTKTKKITTLKIPVYKIEVEVLKGQANIQNIKTPLVQTNLTENKVNVIEEKTTYISWWMLLLAFVLGIFVTILWRFVPTFKRDRKYSNEEALKILYAHISEDAEIEEMVRKLYAKKRGDKSVEIDKKRVKILVDRVI